MPTTDPPANASSSPALVSMRQVSYAYPGSDHLALHDLSLEIFPGEVVGLAGATGSGKSTLCLALNGVVPQFFGGRFFGTLRVADTDTLDTPIHRQAARVALVLQDPATQLLTTRVDHEVAFALENLCLPPDEITARVSEALDAVGLLALREKHPHALSGGQQQRLALAAAFAMRPQLLVLDEPTSQLDPRSSEEVFQLVREFNRRLGMTCVIAGHAAEEMAETVHRLLVLDHGKLVADGPPARIYPELVRKSTYSIRSPEVTQTFVHLSARSTHPLVPPVRLQEGLDRLQSLPPPRVQPWAADASRPSGLPILALDQVSYAYPDGTPALRDVSVSIHRRDFVAVLGQNGAGKSTLIRHFLHLLKPAQGEVRIDGVSVGTYSPTELAQRVGYVPQNPDRQLFNPTVEAEVMFSLTLLRLSAAEREKRVSQVLAELGLSALRHRHPFSLSRGDRARVVIAAVLVLEPEILIFDEPTTGQDEEGARAILSLARRLNEEGRTVIMVTHHLYLLPGYARRVLLMREGRLTLDAPLRDAFHDVDSLESTHLRPTQAVALARSVQPPLRAVTPLEVADAFFTSPAGTPA